jgi:hypothetical protein
MSLKFGKIDESAQSFIPKFEGNDNDPLPSTFEIIAMNEADYSAYHALRLRSDGTVDMAQNRILGIYVKRITNLEVAGKPVKDGAELVAAMKETGIDIHPLILEVVNEIYSISMLKKAEAKNS